MPNPRRTFQCRALVLSGVTLMAGFCPCIVSATLGEPEVSVQSDVAQVKGSIKVEDRTSYRVHEIQLPSGTVLHEYAGSDGTVFAVAWSGPVLPNLRQTLGRYFDTYVAAATANHSGHHHLAVRQQDLVIESSGHMRAFSGRAYLPQAMPNGFGIGDIR